MTSMSKSLPSSGGRREKSEGSNKLSGLHSSQSYSGRSSIMTYKHKQYPSASAALNAYISDYESQLSQSTPVYSRTVSDLLLPPTTLRRTAERSLDTGVRDTKNEFHRFSVRKLIDDSYEHLLKEDLELGHVYSSAQEEPVAYTKTNSSATFHDESASERQFSDVISEISSSTDALLLANPYALPRQHKDRKRLHAKNVRQVTSTQINGSLHNGSLDRSENHARHMVSSRVPRKNPTRHSLSSTVPRENSPRRGVSSRVPREKSTRHSLSSRVPIREPDKSLSGGRRQQVLSRGHSSLQHPSHLKVSSRRHPSEKMEAAGIKRKLATSGSSKDGRLVPTWVTELDSSEVSRSNLATLYVDSLLSEDGHPPTPETFLRSQLDGHSRMNSSELQGTLTNNQPFRNPEMERSLSVMSGTRPPPTWVEDLDITTSTLPVSLRLLARDVDLDASKNPSSVHDEPTQRSSRSGPSDAQANGLSNPASLHSYIQKRTQHPLQLPQSQGEVLSKKYHFRTHSADTEELINESPFGDGTSKVMSSVQLSHYSHGQKHSIRSKGASNSGFKLTEAVRKERKQLPVTTSIQNKRSLSRASHWQPKTQVHVHQPQRVLNGVLGHGATDRILDTSTTTDSLIYSSPFGLDRNPAQADALGIPKDVGLSGSLSPIGSQGSDSTMKEEELASLGTLSSLTVQNVLTGRGEGVPGPLIGDHASETTVGETARANAVIRRANIVVENTDASLNVSSLLQQRNNSLSSNTTEELLAGDQDIMARLRAEMGARDDAPQDPAVQKRMDQFLADCLNSSNQESPEVSEDQVSEGPLESLKNMLFKLQDMASQRTLGTEVQTENGQPKRYSVSSHRAKNAGDKLVIRESSTEHRTSLPGQPPHSSLPQATTAVPPATSALQQATSAQPLEMSAQPLATLAKPRATSAKPRATSALSQKTSELPPAATALTQAASEPSQAASSQPRATSSQPRAASALPHATPAGPSASTSQRLEDESSSFHHQREFDEEPGGRSLQRAMQHLSRLKILVAMETNVS